MLLEKTKQAIHNVMLLKCFAFLCVDAGQNNTSHHQIEYQTARSK